MKALTILLIVLIGLAIVLWHGQSNWTRYTDTLLKKLQAGGVPSSDHVNLAETDGLPGPVRNYFHRALKDGLPIINYAYLSQLGGFRAKPEQKEWSRMEAVQYFSTRPRGFLWNSKISILPGLSIKVLDSYINGQGRMKGKFLSLITLMDVHDDSQLSEGALQRYLAESVWFPTALLPSQGVKWTAINNNKAKATITDSGITVSLEFEFNDQSEIVGVYAPARYREVAGTYEPTPWQGYFSDYMDVGGYLIPKHGEVEWHLKDQTYPYWKADLTEIRYE